MPGAAAKDQPARTVYVLGDSLHDPDLGPHSTNPYLAKLVKKLGLEYVVHAKGEQGVEWGLTQLRQHPPPPGALVVVALGTNDVHDPRGFESGVKKIMAILKDHDVLWVNFYISRAYPPSYGLDRPLNEFIKRQAMKRDNLHVLDWRGYRRRNAIPSSDGLHYFDEGYRQRAKFIAEAIDKSTSSGDSRGALSARAGDGNRTRAVSLGSAMTQCENRCNTTFFRYLRVAQTSIRAIPCGV